jgi:pre-60S factor REI1
MPSYIALKMESEKSTASASRETPPSLSAKQPQHVAENESDGKRFAEVEPEETDTYEEEVGEPFDSSRCLFCRQSNTDVDANLDHMLKKHGLFIEEREKLVVDIETLLCYLNLVISGYCECIYCAAQRSSAEAIRHHMMGKGHCKFDLADEHSPYRDFYDFLHDEVDDDAAEQKTSRRTLHLLQPDENRLPGARYRKPRPPRLKASGDGDHDLGSQPLEPHLPESANSDTTPGDALMTRSEKRGLDLAGRLMRVRASDRRSLVHLPASQQRAILVTHQKQAERMRREERTLQSRMEQMGNKTLMKHFVNDVPGRING